MKLKSLSKRVEIYTMLMVLLLFFSACLAPTALHDNVFFPYYHSLRHKNDYLAIFPTRSLVSDSGFFHNLMWKNFHYESSEKSGKEDGEHHDNNNAKAADGKLTFSYHKNEWMVDEYVQLNLTGRLCRREKNESNADDNDVNLIRILCFRCNADLMHKKIFKFFWTFMKI